MERKANYTGIDLYGHDDVKGTLFTLNKEYEKKIEIGKTNDNTIIIKLDGKIAEYGER